MHRYTTGIAAALLVLLVPQGALAEAGRFLSVVGDVRVVAVDGTRRAAERGSEVDSGETVVTGEGAFAQLTMTDGARLQVREDTELKLDDYDFQGGESTAGRMFMSLVRGTMRSITGLIGSRRRESYGVRTPHATIGIRGTDHQVTVLLAAREGFQPGTFDVVFSGGTVMRTARGFVNVAPRQAAYTTGQDVLPRVIQVPAFLQPGAVRAAPSRPSAAVTRGGDAGGDAGKAEGSKGAPTGKADALRTPLSSTPLRTPLSSSTSTLTTKEGTTLEGTTKTLESYQLDSSKTLLESYSRDGGTSTTTTDTTKTLSPSLIDSTTSTKTLDSTTTKTLDSSLTSPLLSPSTTTLSPSTTTLSPSSTTTLDSTTTKTLDSTTIKTLDPSLQLKTLEPSTTTIRR